MSEPVLDLSRALGDVIRWLRQYGPAGPMSQAELGRRAGGVVRQAVTNWEKGRRMPDLPQSALIATALGVMGWQLVRAGQLHAGGMAAGAAVALALGLDRESEVARGAARVASDPPLERRMPR
jgi:transcriptional regulator with XRE-family HTH domain